MSYKTGDIVLIKFPFTNFSKAKKRPVLVVKSENNLGDFICFQITSKATSLNLLKIDSQNIQDGILTLSTSKDKGPNRQIRNELIGHPVSKDKTNNNRIKSSVLLDIENFNNKTINYHKYSRENKFKPEKNSILIDEIINSHIAFVMKFLNRL